MPYTSALPDIEAAKIVAAKLLKTNILEAKRLTTGGKNFVFWLSTNNDEFVIRMTAEKYKKTYESAIYWQNKLLPLGVPLAKFIAQDLDGQFSPFPAMLMQRIPGNDICNLYNDLSTTAKQNLAQQLVKIHAKTTALPIGSSFGFANSYEEPTNYKSWYDFLLARLALCGESLKKTTAFASDTVNKVLEIAANMRTNFSDVLPQPFMWDTSERNVIINNDQIAAIVDVDDMCFGDPLFVLGLTYVALELLGFDTIYCDTWAKLLELDQKAQLRLDFYRLFYTTWFMRHHADVVSDNGTAYNLNADILKKLFLDAIDRINEHNKRAD